MEKRIQADMERFNYLTSEIDAAYHEAALKLGLSDSAMQILYAVCNHGEPCPLRDICRLSGTSKQTINSALRRLEAEGILYLEPLGGKKKQVCLTDCGRDTVERTVMRLIQVENDIFDSWTKAEREAYIALTQKYLSSFKERLREM